MNEHNNETEKKTIELLVHLWATSFGRRQRERRRLS